MVEPASGVRDFTWIATELAKRTGVLKGYNAAINNGLTGIPLRTKEYNFALDESAEHSKEEIWDHVCRAASFEVTGGAASDGLDYYLEHGLRVSEYPRTNWYLYPTMVAKGLRFELPYQERLMRIGIELGNRLHEKGIDWWDKQLAEYWRCRPGTTSRVSGQRPTNRASTSTSRTTPSGCSPHAACSTPGAPTPASS